MTPQAEIPNTVLPIRGVDLMKNFALQVLGACRDLVPIVLVILIFQLLVLRRPLSTFDKNPDGRPLHRARGCQPLGYVQMGVRQLVRLATA